MPPKRTPSTRNSAKKTVPPPEAEASGPEDEDVKPSIDQASPGAEQPPDAPTNSQEPLSASVTPAPSTITVASDTAVSSSRTPAPASRGKKPVSQPKFAGRRSAAKREELQKADEEKKRVEAEAKAVEDATRARQQAKSRGAGRGGRGDVSFRSTSRGGPARGRGRGGYMGQSQREAIASGPFSAGQVEKDANNRWRKINKGAGGSDGSRGGGWQTGQASQAERPDGESRAKAPTSTKKSTKAADGRTVKQEAGPGKSALDKDGDTSMGSIRPLTSHDGGYISSDDEEDEKGMRRMNVEDLGVIDLTQDDAPAYASFAPVRVARVAHKERALGINADGATNQEGTITVDANDKATDTAVEKSKSKQRVHDLEITGEASVFQGTYSDSESDTERQPRIKPDPEPRPSTPEPAQPATVSADVHPQDPQSSHESKRKGKEKIKSGSSSSHQPVEFDLSQHQTREEAEEYQRHQTDLELIRKELGVPAEETDHDGDAAMTDATASKDRRAEKVYLFQFPPVLPHLEPMGIKPDPDGVTKNNSASSDKSTTVAPNTNSKPSPQPNLPSGAVGKLRVHASGRVTLDWGGTSLEMGMGTEASFLQDVLVANVPERKGEEDGDGGQRGSVISMGQVKGKFVVTPDWGAMFGA